MFNRKKFLAAQQEEGKPVREEEAVSVKSTASVRLLNDMASLSSEDKLDYPDPKNPLKFIYTAKPTAGFWKGAEYRFGFDIPTDYPFKAPKVKCIDKIYHPNIDFDGSVCVSTLRPWNPINSIQTILFSLMILFTHPNADDTLNEIAGKDLRDNKDRFALNVLKSLNGQAVGEVSFEPNPGTSYKRL